MHEPPIMEEDEDVTITPSKTTDTTTMLHMHEEEPDQDTQSVQSVPVVQVTEPSSPTVPMSSHSASTIFMSSPTTTLTPTGTPTSSSSRDRRRSMVVDSVVVMEHRGVLVAIAGRRDGVRVYALDEVKKAIEWRMEVEIKRERDRARREEAKRVVSGSYDALRKNASGKDGKLSLFPTTPTGKDKNARRASISTIEPTVPSPGIPRNPTIKRPKPTAPAGPPPAYSPSLRHGTSHLNINANSSRARTTSVNDVLAGTMNRRRFSDELDRDQADDTKADWASSDDEAINPVAAPSGSQALDERTSANVSTPSAPMAGGRGLGPTNAQTPAPKLEYVKLPGTKGSVMVKAVETARKSFLAILCGDNGEKVELFAGTYRTALGLSRTFILPDSPRSLELQLQGDDLVEVFLVFSQNVFGLEPATVRVRETGEGDADGSVANEEDTAVNVSIGVAFTPSPSQEDAQEDSREDAMLAPTLNSPNPSIVPTLISDTPTNSHEVANATDELLAMAAASASPYTTFQQMSFAPKFPLAAIADEYVIPPTYPSFIDYRTEYEPEADGQPKVDLAQIQFSPPGLPVPVSAPPSRWFYKDPKGIVHGPWKAALMQAWYQDGLLPPELPVRREEDTEYTLLKDLRLQSVDPAHPFRSSPPPPSHTHAVSLPLDESKPLLQPISLLKQPRHFGPPALFFSTRGGHSTAIVDARGRSVLKSRFLWSSDDNESDFGVPRLGDVKRLEAFDVRDRAVLVAMRQGGLEVVDFGDALLRPADFSRTVYPLFNPPLSSINRRGPYVWKIGTPISSLPSGGISSPVGLPVKFPAHRLQPKKQSTGPAKSPARSEFYSSADEAFDEEMLFLARRDDEIFLCERRTGSFRILRLSVSDN
ncbi:hypothetical protein EUX98_g5 [Antrodiella citrinella]|uniref:GYF domain-containing protein n=1 Tax=Antrodiella citrinella TaxID=2447956 RepID=A0A4S4N7R2_9APHY|nr:hypothetical protein EUX98_g5 [Antrodiella citrinella]